MNQKITTLKTLTNRAHTEKVWGFTSGTFDLLHVGHVDYLKKAKSLCDYLVVGVNSDISVKKYKSPLRPFVNEKDRVALIAALEMVDYAFLFDEVNNQNNIHSLKPDIYIKAGDYSRESLSSAKLVESYGGRIEIVPFTSGFSSTALIEKIQAQALAFYSPLPLSSPRPALFIDRDGTLIELVEYLSNPTQVTIIEGAGRALKEAREKGYWIVVITNQQGIGLGYFSLEDFYKTNLACLKALSKEGALIDKVYFCPSSMSEHDDNRKPGIGMIERACRELPIIKEQSLVIGDTTTDIQTGTNAGMKTVLVKTGKGGLDGVFDAQPHYTIDSISQLIAVL